MKRLALSLGLFALGCSSDGVQGEGLPHDQREHDGEGDADGDGDGDGETVGDGDTDHPQDENVGGGDTDDSETTSDAGMTGGLAACGFRACSPDTVSNARSGKTPWGTFDIAGSGVEYTLGFTNNTRVRLIGSIAGEPAELHFEVSTWEADPPHLIPPGTYRSPGGDEEAFLEANLYRATSSTNEQCERVTLQGIELVIEHHVERSTMVDVGEPVELWGVAEVKGNGFDLEVPFNIERICDRHSGL